jgi:hypothetical protein
MIQDAHPVRSGVPDGYDVLIKVTKTAGPVYTLDTTRLPSGFSVSAGAAGRMNVVFPTCFAVRWLGGAVDAKVFTVTSQRKVNPVNINPSAGTLVAQFLDNTATPIEVDPVDASDVYLAFRIESL